MKNFLFIFFVFSGAVISAELENCHKILKDIIKDPAYSNQIQNILKIQGKLTLHRLAWAGMHDKDGEKNFKLEKKIESILKTLHTNKDKKFLEAKEMFEKNKLSRTALARVLPYISEILNEQNKITDTGKRKKFILQSSDMKLLAILAEKESLKTNGLFDHRLYKDHKSDNSILNFTTIINSSMRDRPISPKTKKKFSEQLNKLTDKVNQEIVSLPIGQPCIDQLMLSCGKEVDFNPVVNTFMSFIKDVDRFEKHNSLKYGDVWLHVGGKKYTKKQKKPKVEEKIKFKLAAKSFSIKEKKYMDVLATRVIDHYPYFTTKKQLLADKELLFSLAFALDNKDPYFLYRGKDGIIRKYELLEGYNKTDLKQTGKDIIDGLEGSMGITAMDRKLGLPQVKIFSDRKKIINSFKSKIPDFKKTGKGNSVDEQTLKKLNKEFFETIVGANFGKPVQKVFEFRGSLYYSDSGIKIKRLDPSVLMEHQGPKVKNKTLSPFEQYNIMAEKQKDVVIEEANSGKVTYVYENKLRYISNANVDVDEVISKKTTIIPKDFKKRLKEKDYTPVEKNKTPILNELNVVRAIVEGDKAVLLGPNTINPMTLKVYSYKDKEKITNKFQIANKNIDKNNLPAVNLLSLDSEKRDQWFLGIQNDDSVFNYKNEKFNTLTTEKIETGFVKTPNGFIRFEDKKKRIEEINGLDDKNLIIEYHKNFSVSNSCDYYTVIDKQNNNLSVYKNNGDLNYSKEVLTGKNEGDKRLIFMEESYAKGGRKTNGKTAAGIFSSFEFRTEEMNKLYSKMNNCSLAIVTEKDITTNKLNKSGDHETVMALHSVPKNLMSRMPAFNNDNNEDNKTTNGCINLRPNDCIEYKEKFKDAGCPVYILPSEKDELGNRVNRMKIVNSKVSFTPVNRAKCNKTGLCNKDYYYSVHKKENSKKIELKVFNTENASNPNVKKILETLEKRKKELSVKLKLTNEQYNELAEMVYAVIGVESGFGKDDRYQLKEGGFLKNISSTLRPGILRDYLSENAQNLSQTSVSTYKKVVKGNNSVNSRGLSQIKDVLTYTKEHYPEITEDSLDNPEEATIATFIVVNEMRKQLNTLINKGGYDNITSLNWREFLYYPYNGSSSQIKNGAAAPAVNIRAKKIKEFIKQIHVYEEM